MQRAFVLTLAIFAATFAMAATPPAYRYGFITAIASPAEFSFNGQAVVTDAKTRLALKEADKTITSDFDMSKLAVGDWVKLEGHASGETYIADSVLKPKQDEAYTHPHGVAIVLETQSAAPGKLIRLAGWPVQVTAAAQAPSMLEPGMLVDFKAKREKDGVMQSKELHLDTKQNNAEAEAWNSAHAYALTPPDFDLQKDGSVTVSDTQHITLPANDKARSGQHRLQALAEKLVPAALRPQTHLQCFVVQDDPYFRAGEHSPSGQIFFAQATIENLSDDALAGLLAIHVASLLWHEDYRVRKMHTAMNVEQMVAIAATPFVPSEGISTAYDMAHHDARPQGGLYQNLCLLDDMRYGLDLMRIAGYDAMAMPLAVLRSVELPDNELPAAYMLAMHAWREYNMTPPALPAAAR